MKNVLLLTAVLTLMVISACKKDPNPEELIIGRWVVTSHISNGEEIIVKTPQFQLHNEIEFSENGAFVLDVVNIDLTQTPPKNSFGTSSGTYSWNEGALTFGLRDKVRQYSVTGNAVVSKSRLVFVATSADKDYPLKISRLEAERM